MMDFIHSLTQDIGGAANLLISSLVVAFGVCWLVKHRADNYFSVRVYACFWASWLAWIGVWLLLAGNAGAGVEFVLLGDNVNAALLFLVGYIIWKAPLSFSLRWALQPLCCIGGALSIALYGGDFCERYLGVPDASLYITMVGAALAPIAVGFAFHRRFKARPLSPLIVGILYGLIQPLAYATELNAFDAATDLAGIKSAVSISLAALKVTWAIVCTRVLSSGRLIGVPWRRTVVGHTVALTGLFLLILFGLLVSESAPPANFQWAFTFVTGILGTVGFLWHLWDKLCRHAQVRQGVEASPS